jgi:hypothetical protein
MIQPNVSQAQAPSPYGVPTRGNWPARGFVSDMFAVVGAWEMDPSLASVQQDVLRRIVSGVRQAPGLVKGYWTGPGESGRAHTFIVFVDRQNADVFATDVRNNIENQARAGVRNLSLDVAEISAET